MVFDDSKDSSTVNIYTDGSCLGNPGAGGWAALLKCRDREKELSGFEAQTTNNRMELTAAIEALRALSRPSQVVLYTDSNYLKLGISEWLAKWQKNNWRTSQRKPVLNKDLWQDLSTENERHSVQWRWVKAHNGDPDNERVDSLARDRAIEAQQNSPF